MITDNEYHPGTNTSQDTQDLTNKVDDKGRRKVTLMSADECAQETLAIARAVQDTVEKFFTDMQTGKLSLPGPLGMMMKMMGGK
jgi:hypothetical protein